MSGPGAVWALDPDVGGPALAALTSARVVCWADLGALRDCSRANAWLRAWTSAADGTIGVLLTGAVTSCPVTVPLCETPSTPWATGAELAAPWLARPCTTIRELPTIRPTPTMEYNFFRDPSLRVLLNIDLPPFPLAAYDRTNGRRST